MIASKSANPGAIWEVGPRNIEIVFGNTAGGYCIAVGCPLGANPVSTDNRVSVVDVRPLILNKADPEIGSLAGAGWKSFTVVPAIFRHRGHQDAVGEIGTRVRAALHGKIAAAVKRRVGVAPAAGAADPEIIDPNGKNQGHR